MSNFHLSISLLFARYCLFSTIPSGQLLVIPFLGRLSHFLVLCRGSNLALPIVALVKSAALPLVPMLRLQASMLTSTSDHG